MGALCAKGFRGTTGLKAAMFGGSCRNSFARRVVESCVLSDLHESVTHSIECEIDLYSFIARENMQK